MNTETSILTKSHPEAKASWLTDGQKYALVALEVKFEGPLGLQQLTPSLWAFDNANFEMPTHWHEWLGSIRAKEVERSNLFLLSKLNSVTPDILDDENEQLKKHVWHFYSGLLLSSRFAPAHSPALLTGSCRDGEIGVRQQQDFDPIIPCVFRGYPAISPSILRQAATLGANIEKIAAASLPDGHWRLFRILYLYVQTRTVAENIDRVHQYLATIVA